MMRKAAALGILLIAAFATPALAQSFVGDWKATAHVQGTDVSETLHVTKAGDGYAIEAKAIDAPADAPQAGPGTDIVLQGDNFSYKRSLSVGAGDPITITYKGVVSGDTFTGTAEVGGGTVSYTGVRMGSGK
jgi:hypothetical protein